MEKPASTRREAPPRPIRYCVVPGCSHRACRTYAVLCAVSEGAVPVSNEIQICGFHHSCLRKGYLRVRGRAPDGLVWMRQDGELFTVGG